MWQIVFRVSVGLLFIIHGFAHWQITTGWGSKTTIESWLMPILGQSTLESLGNFLWVAALIVFVGTGIVLFFGAQWWRGLAVAGSLLSLLVIIFFWQPNMILGAAVDAGILVALLWVNWPTPQLLGA
jgi:hypothetical protein